MLEQVAEKSAGFDVEVGYVTCNGGLVNGNGDTLLAALEGFVVGGCADC